ncbi:MAG: putative integral rane protein [Candidatus Saccharibacteria bacterium]|nr:putative integral rane protein [Candidatus Saccharibacteria bacterium]
MSAYLVVIALAWAVAQGAKFIRAAVANKGSASLRLLYTSGNMPSSHSAIVVAMLTIIGLKDGIESGLFGLAVLLAVIVMYDAVMVRRSSGEQGEALQALIKEQKSAVRQPRAARGHQPAEVAVGALIGLLTGLLVYFIL